MTSLLIKLAILATNIIPPGTYFGFYSKKQRQKLGGVYRYQAFDGTGIVECTEVCLDGKLTSTWDDMAYVGPLGTFVSNTKSHDIFCSDPYKKSLPRISGFSRSISFDY